MYRAFVDEVVSLSKMPVAYEASGLLEAAFDEAALVQLEAKVAWQKAVGLRAELLSPERARELEPHLSEKILGAAYYPDDHQVDNRQLLRGLAKACEELGVVFTRQPVRRILAEGKGVDVAGETHRADKVVLAAGARSADISSGLLPESHIKPVRGQMVELRPEKGVLRQIVSSPQGYLVPRRDGRVIAGSTAESVGFDKNVTAAGLKTVLDAAIELVPDLASAAVVQTWAGLRPWTDHQLPVIGEGPQPGLLLATGHFRNGILLAPITARLLGQLVRQERPTVDLRHFRYHRRAE
jgi:glycine oxidase